VASAVLFDFWPLRLRGAGAVDHLKTGLWVIGAQLIQTASGTTPTAMEILFGHLSSSRNATRARQWVKQMG
jgi:hypothetical protein